jgi:hypothetical protein
MRAVSLRRPSLVLVDIVVMMVLSPHVGLMSASGQTPCTRGNGRRAPGSTTTGRRSGMDQIREAAVR